MVIKLPLIFVLTSNKANRKDTAYRTFLHSPAEWPWAAAGGCAAVWQLTELGGCAATVLEHITDSLQPCVMILMHSCVNKCKKCLISS